MSKTVFVHRSHLAEDGHTQNTRGNKIKVEEGRYKELVAAGLIGDKPPRPRPSVAPRPERHIVRGPIDPEEREPIRQDRQGRRTQERRGRETKGGLEEAFNTIRDALLEAGVDGAGVGDFAKFETQLEAARQAKASGVLSPNAGGLQTLGETAEATGETRTQRADETGQGDGSSREPETEANPGKSEAELAQESRPLGGLTNESIPAKPTEPAAPAVETPRPKRGQRTAEE